LNPQAEKDLGGLNGVSGKATNPQAEKDLGGLNGVSGKAT
jgi:hypothetical protein